MINILHERMYSVFVEDKPHLTMHYTPNKVYERKSVTVCCCCDSRSSFLEIWSSKNSLIRSSKLNKNVLCHRIIHVSRYDSGVYRCFADFDIGIVNVDVKIVVLCKCNCVNIFISLILIYCYKIRDQESLKSQQFNRGVAYIDIINIHVLFKHFYF